MGSRGVERVDCVEGSRRRGGKGRLCRGRGKGKVGEREWGAETV